jgi:hypothetical protein
MVPVAAGVATCMDVSWPVELPSVPDLNRSHMARDLHVYSEVFHRARGLARAARSNFYLK